ncbi:MAG: FHA domain-containing protein [Chloroflexi bacterium]|nr:FHA domain-containing protein [Chloroflexota bacterium]
MGVEYSYPLSPCAKNGGLTTQDAYLVFNQIIFPLTKPITHIGRKSGNDLVIQGLGVSRLLAQIRFEDEEFVLYDLNSSNGTFINQRNGCWVMSGVLFSGALILLGDITLVFVRDNKKITKSLEMDTGELNTE